MNIWLNLANWKGFQIRKKRQLLFIYTYILISIYFKKEKKTRKEMEATINLINKGEMISNKWMKNVIIYLITSILKIIFLYTLSWVLFSYSFQAWNTIISTNWHNINYYSSYNCMQFLSYCDKWINKKYLFHWLKCF